MTKNVSCHDVMPLPALLGGADAPVAAEPAIPASMTVLPFVALQHIGRHVELENRDA
jgi:hypothetical protein